MTYNWRDLKIISIIQIVMTVIFFTLGVVDGFAVRFMYSSLTFTACWIAVLVLPAGIMGLILSNMHQPSATMITALQSVSVACAALSAVVVYHYLYALSFLTTLKYASSSLRSENPYFVDADTDIKSTKKQRDMVAISSLIIIFCIIEIIIAVASAKSSHAGGQVSQGNQENFRYGQLEAGRVPIQLQAQPTGIPAQPMVVVPVSADPPSYSVNQ